MAEVINRAVDSNLSSTKLFREPSKFFSVLEHACCRKILKVFNESFSERLKRQSPLLPDRILTTSASAVEIPEFRTSFRTS
ncbi:hypothetical protein PGTUg99_000526 [Puccinia graminis f. sp. tritici]|uniref:Uncharacterized protein n=1 Tax=Puccinia graminis f. sp. tritici TaxID=56615 RepID=A0A5B0QYD8_PUCGR|nr:hypothetical protein PGTUg99_000526 [Puccinia graminis f. sp. tritici]